MAGPILTMKYLIYQANPSDMRTKIISGKDVRMVWRALHNACAYLCIGDESLGVSVSDMRPLYNVLGNVNEYALSEHEWLVAKAALQACLKYIDDWEIPAVFDVDITKEDVQKFYDEHFKSDDGK